ncbi:MAG: type IVB secretion system apparatus protein IcmL/DotI [Gammaproteobacteria bacterium]|nr:type IVB secretion system apparatus protein IcmL/DotI [Gammaproteobacteria bacterium]
MSQDVIETVQNRNHFYRDNYQRVMIVLLLMVMVNVVLAGLIFYQFTHRPSPRYFAMSADGKIVKLQPLRQPVLADDVVLQWAARAAVDAFSYNFVNYREALQKLQNRFSERGWQNYEAALKQAQQLDTVVSKHLVVSAVATGAPVVLDKGILNGRYVWKIQLPLLVTYQSASEQTQEPLVITMIVSRVQVFNHPQGIAVVSFVAAEGRAS